MNFANFVKVIKLWSELILPPASVPRIDPDLYKYFDEFCLDNNFTREQKNSRYFNYRITWYRYVDWQLDKYPDSTPIGYEDFKIEFDSYFNPR